jgi:hypothetical protein
LRDYQDPRYLAIHRIDAAQVLDRAAQRPKGFDIDAFITQEFGIRLGTKPLQLVLKVQGHPGRLPGRDPHCPGAENQAPG